MHCLFYRISQFSLIYILPVNLSIYSDCLSVWDLHVSILRWISRETLVRYMYPYWVTCFLEHNLRLKVSSRKCSEKRWCLHYEQILIIWFFDRALILTNSDLPPGKIHWWFVCLLEKLSHCVILFQILGNGKMPRVTGQNTPSLLFTFWRQQYCLG